MSEIKFDLILKNQIFCYMLLFAIIKLLPTLRLSRKKTNCLSFRVNLVLFSVFMKNCIVLGKNIILYLENEPK